MEPQTFNLDAVQPFYEDAPRPSAGISLDSARSFTAKQGKRSVAMLNRRKAAKAALERLPEPGESIHCILRGDFALFDFVPAILELADRPIDSLVIATLGANKRNTEALDELIQAGQLRNLAILCSHYFAAADQDVYAHMAALCDKHSFPIAAMRSHAKLLLFAIGERRIVVESSANLRSCHNVEQATLFDDVDLYDFHRQWIFELLEQGAAQ